MDRSELIIKLREATREVHDRLHHDPDMLALQSGAIAQDRYRNLMLRIGGFYGAFDAKVLQACLRLEDALNGYSYKARHPMFPDSAPSSLTLPSITTLGALAGAVYVVDGAVLGGQVLGRAAGKENRHPYWDWCAREGPSVWRGAKALIAEADTSASERRAAIGTACAVFAAFEEALAPTPDPVPA